MRLISQNGSIDVPYDKVILGICDQNNKQEYVIYAYHDSPRPLFLATYSTTDKAIKAMEMLREQYAHMKRVECFSSSLTSNHLYTLSNKEAKLLGDEVQKLMCFQFPQDEDVEV